MSTPFVGTAALTELWAKVKAYVTNALTSKQDALVSGTNIKTINSQSILGSGNIVIEGGSGGTSAVDYVIEQASTTTGGYRKWSSGRMEAWTKRTVSATVSTSWGNLYRSSDYYTGGSWPETFQTLNHCWAYITADGGDMAYAASVSSATTSRGDNVYILRGSTLTSAKTFVINWYGVGTWGTGETINVADETEY